MKLAANVGIGISILLCSCATSRLNLYDGVPYSSEVVAGTWFGFAQADLFVYRVRLDFPNSGVGACISPFPETFTNFSIGDWNVEDINSLTIHISRESGLDSIRGHLLTATMFSGEVIGTDGWTNEVMFYKEGPFADRLKWLQETMGDH
jgi:hypothetical protein